MSQHPSPAPSSRPSAGDAVARTMFIVCLVAGLSFVLVIFTGIL